MRRRVKYLDFTITDSIWKKSQPFLALPIINGDKSVKALLRWNPGRYKTEWRIRLTNSHTKEKHSYPLTEVIYRHNWMLVVWNPHEAIDAIMGILPVVLTSTVVANIIGGNREAQSSNNSQRAANQDA